MSSIDQNKDRSIDEDLELSSDWIVLLVEPLQSSYGTGAKLTLQVVQSTSMAAS